MRLISSLILLAALTSPAAAQRYQGAQPGWIGISLDITTADDKVRSDPPVLIAEVRRGSPAQEAGLRAGDRLLAIGDLSGADDFRNLPERLRLSVGDRVRIRVEREGRRVDVVLRAAERPSDAMPRTVRLAMDADSMVEVMMRAMDSLQVQLVRVTADAERVVESSGRLRIGREDRPSAVSFPFEFFVFRGEEHDSLRQAMEDLNRLSEDLQRRENVMIQELRQAVSSQNTIPDTDEQLRMLRTSLEQVTRESASVRAAMSQAARVTAGFDYDVSAWTPGRGQPPTRAGAPEFRPLTPYLLGSNRVAGAQVIDLRPELAQYFGVAGGVLVVDIADGTPASMAGMLPGDVITRLGQVAIRSVEELRFGVSRSGESLPIRLVRQGDSLEVLLTRR